MAGRDPLVEYQNEAFDMFQSMTQGIKEEFVRYIFHAQVVELEQRPTVRLVESSGGGRARRPSSAGRTRSAETSPAPAAAARNTRGAAAWWNQKRNGVRSCMCVFTDREWMCVSKRKCTTRPQ